MLLFQKLLIFSLCLKVLSSQQDLTNNEDYFHIHRAMILNDCNKDYESIIIIDDANKLDLMWVQQLHEEFHSVILHKGNIQDPEDYSELKKVDAILITVSSVSRIKPILKHYSKRSWWNVMIPVYILNLPHNDCKETMDILHQTWTEKILTVYFLCIKKNIIDIYTYNPFTNRAPKSWKAIERSSTEPRWTLYHRKYQKETICHELNFDRTKYLDGYPITAMISAFTRKGFSLVGQYINSSDLNNSDMITTEDEFMLMKAIEKNLNVRFRYYVISLDEIAQTNKLIDVVLEEISKNVSASIIETYFTLPRIPRLNHTTMAYALAWNAISIATYHYGYQTLAEKMWDFYGTWTILFTILVLFITFAVIRFIERRKTAFTVFEILRLLINHSLHTPMNNLYLRIFFLTILIYFLIIHATFSGHLAKFLTKPELRRHPDTLEDLRALGYTKIYNSTSVKGNVELESPYEDWSANYCIHHLLYKDSSVACIFDRALLIENAHQEEKVYISKKILQDQFARYPIVKNWPLVNRVNIVTMSLEDLGLRQFISNLTPFSFFKLRRAESKLNEKFHPIQLKHLTLCFLMLAFGLISATISFCIEMYFSYKVKSSSIPDVKNNKKKVIMNRCNVIIQHQWRKRLRKK